MLPRTERVLLKRMSIFRKVLLEKLWTKEPLAREFNTPQNDATWPLLIWYSFYSFKLSSLKIKLPWLNFLIISWKENIKGGSFVMVLFRLGKSYCWWDFLTSYFHIFQCKFIQMLWPVKFPIVYDVYFLSPFNLYLYIFRSMYNVFFNANIKIQIHNRLSISDISFKQKF